MKTNSGINVDSLENSVMRIEPNSLHQIPLHTTDTLHGRCQIRYCL